MGSQCSQTCGTGGYQLQQATRPCNNPTPLGGGQNCDPNGALVYRNATCQNDPLPACGKFSKKQPFWLFLRKWWLGMIKEFSM